MPGLFRRHPAGRKQREIIARNLGISARNDYAMLEQIGGECAGAVTFIPAGGPLPERNYGYRKLSEKELAEILRELPSARCWRATRVFACRWPAHRTRSPCASKTAKFPFRSAAHRARISLIRR